MKFYARALVGDAFPAESEMTFFPTGRHHKLPGAPPSPANQSGIASPLIAALFHQNGRAQDHPPPTTKVLVKAYKISRTIDGIELESLVAPYVGSDMGLAELEKVAEVVTVELKDRGYSLARAYIPPQDTNDGVMEIVVVEGKVGEIIVKGTRTTQQILIKRRFTRLSNRALSSTAPWKNLCFSK